jgi:cell shape-determining protein MreC
MNYAPKSRSTNFQSSRAKSGVSLPLKIVLILAVVLVVFYTLFPRVLPAVFLSLAAPLWKADAEARLGNTSMEELRTSYADIAINTDKNNSLIAENDELKILLGRTTITKPLLATILKKPPFSAYDSFILDVGAPEGVAKGNRVYALGNIPIGQIAEVVGDTSRVSLYSSSGEKFDILIGPSQIEATAIGKGGGNFEVSLPRDTKIKKGDLVHIPALSDNFVGTVDGIVSAPSEPFAKILFHQPVNMYEGRFVIIDTHVHEQ